MDISNAWLKFIYWVAVAKRCIKGLPRWPLWEDSSSCTLQKPQKPNSENKEGEKSTPRDGGHTAGGSSGGRSSLLKDCTGEGSWQELQLLERSSHKEQLLWQGKNCSGMGDSCWFNPDGLYSSERTHSGEILEELKPIGLEGPVLE